VQRVTAAAGHNKTQTRSVGLLWTRDRPVAEISTLQHTTLTDSQAPGGIRTRNPSKRAATGITQHTDFLNVFCIDSSMDSSLHLT